MDGEKDDPDKIAVDPEKIDALVETVRTALNLSRSQFWTLAVTEYLRSLSIITVEKKNEYWKRRSKISRKSEARILHHGRCNPSREG